MDSNEVTASKANGLVYWALIIVFVILLYRLWSNNSTDEHYKNNDKNKNEDNKLEFTNSEIKTLKSIAKAFSSGYVRMPNLRVTGEVVVDGGVHCKRNLTAREINSVKVSGNVVDGATVKGESVKDNNNLLVKRGQRIRVTDAAGMYQVWTIENDD
jgi:hypothetical protein